MAFGRTLERFQIGAGLFIQVLLDAGATGFHELVVGRRKLRGEAHTVARKSNVEARNASAI